MNDRAELVARLMAELTARFEDLAQAASDRQVPSQIDEEALAQIAQAASDAARIAEAAHLLV